MEAVLSELKQEGLFYGDNKKAVEDGPNEDDETDEEVTKKAKKDKKAKKEKKEKKEAKAGKKRKHAELSDD